MSQTDCPTANPILAASEVCPGMTQDLSLTFDRSATHTYLWEVAEGGTIMGSATGASVSILWNSENGGPHQVKLTERLGNCFYENSVMISVADDFERGRFNCFGNINMPFDQNCERMITPAMLMSSGTLDCPDAFDVTLTIDGKTLVPNPVPLSYAGQVIIATIVHRESRRSCTSYITLQDGTKPQLTCKNDTSICLDPDVWSPFGVEWNTPTVTDNCDPTVTAQPIRSEWIDLLEDPVFTGFIKRDWAATDKAGNVGECSDTIFLLRLDLDQLDCPSDTTILCDSLLANPDDPTIAGSPSFAGFSLYVPDNQCEFSIKFEDQKSPRCYASYIIDRVWTIKSFADGNEHVYTCEQRIEIVDTLGPQITFVDPRIQIEQHDDVPDLDPLKSYKTIYYPTLDFGCVASGYFPAPTVEDNCSPLDLLTVDLIWPTGHVSYAASEEDPHLLFTDLSYGKHIVQVVARDDCHNQSKDTLVIVTKDRQAPYIVADKDPTVGLTSYSDVTWVDVANFDEGTYDNCHLVAVLGRRLDWDSSCYYTSDSLVESEVRQYYDTYYEWLKKDSTHCADSIDYGWTDQIPFCCADACPGKPVTIELMALDAHCNISYLWLDVYVEDKTPPEVPHRLPDLEISCKAYSEYYKAQIDSANWSVFGTYEEASHTYGNILDSITTTVVKNKICYDPPKPIYPDGPVYHDTKPIGYEFYDWTYDTIKNGLVYDNCGVGIRERQKVHLDKCGTGWIERIFTIDGTCSTHTQDSLVLKQRIAIVNDCPFYEEEIIWPQKDTTIYGCSAGEVITPGPQLRILDECRDIGIHHQDAYTDALYGIDSVCQKIIRTWAVIDWCRQTEEYHEEWYQRQDYHYYEYEQIIYVKDTLGPEILDCDLDTLCIGSECDYDLNHTIAVQDECTPADQILVKWQLYRIIPEGFHLVMEGEGTTMNADALIVGEYKAVWSVTDGCHVSSYCTDYFSVIDCKPPSAICFSATTVKLFPVDLNHDAEIDTAIAEVWAEELNQSSSDNCDQELVDFRIRWKTETLLDADGQTLVPDSSSRKLNIGCQHIGSNLVEFWAVDAHGNAAFCDVLIEVQAPAGGCPDSDGSISGSVRTINGAPIPGVQAVLQSPSHQEEAISDIKGQYSFTGYDMVQGGHTVSLTHTDEPIEGISTADLIQISKHILGKASLEDPLRQLAADANGNGSISVADLITIRKLLLGKIESLPIEKPWHFYNAQNQEAYNFDRNSIVQEMLSFRGVKIGDVNGDVVRAEGKSRSRHGVELHFEDMNVVPGDLLRIGFRLNTSEEFEGIQMALNSIPDKLTFESVDFDGLDLDQTNYHIDKDRLAIVWHGLDNLEAELAFSVQVLAKESGTLSDWLSLSDEQLSAEVYPASGSEVSIALVASDPSATDRKIKAYPNPFSDLCTLEFDGSYGSEAKIDVYNALGQLVYTRSMTLQDGLNRLQLYRHNLPKTGVHTFKIETVDQKYRGRLLVID